MQLVLSNNRIIAHGENFLVIGDAVINTETGAKYENATVAKCDSIPPDIDSVGYEYHAGMFVPCAPFPGTGDNNGYFMEVCADCATPRNSGIPIKKGIRLSNLAGEVTAVALGGASVALLWSNAAPASNFSPQVVRISTLYKYRFIIISFWTRSGYSSDNEQGEVSAIFDYRSSYAYRTGGGAVALDVSLDNGTFEGYPDIVFRPVKIHNDYINFGGGWRLSRGGSVDFSSNASSMVPRKIYGVTI